jgi:hypothetical protein
MRDVEGGEKSISCLGVCLSLETVTVTGGDNYSGLVLQLGIARKADDSALEKNYFYEIQNSESRIVQI